MTTKGNRVVAIIMVVLVSMVLFACSSKQDTTTSTVKTTATVTTSSTAVPSSTATISSTTANKDPYKVGVSAALTGPYAVSYSPYADLYRVYIERLNDQGGINGHPVQVTYGDDRGEAGTAATNAQRFVGMGVNLMIVMSGSATYGPIIAVAKPANIPVFIGGASASQAMPPNPDPLVYNLLPTSPLADAYKLTQSLSVLDKPANMKVGIIVLDIPAAVAGAKLFSAAFAQYGLSEPFVKTVPADTVDFSSIASQFKAAGVNWITEFGPLRIGKRLYEAMTKLGWQGKLLTGYDTPELLQENKDPNIFVNYNCDPFGMDLPIHDVIKQAAAKYHAQSLVTSGIMGWTMGMLTQQIFNDTGWPITTDKMLARLNNWTGSRAPFSGPAVYTPTNHSGPTYYRNYTWSAEQNRIVAATNWFQMDTLGGTATDLGATLK